MSKELWRNEKTEEKVAYISWRNVELRWRQVIGNGQDAKA